MDSAPRPHYQVTFGILAVGIGAFALLQSLVIPVLSAIQVELHTSQSAVTWVLTAYLPSASALTAARVLRGLGGGPLPLGFGIIRDESPAGRVAGAVGTLAALTAVGGSG